MLRVYLLAAMLCFSVPVLAGPPARIEDMAWIEGSWEGEGIDGAPALEVYSRAADGKIIGHFRQLHSDGTVMFYELLSIEEKDGSLNFSVKHFNADLTGWEEKSEVRRFPLSSANSGRWDFSGLVYERTGADEMTASVTTKNTDGKQEKLVFRYRRNSG